MTDAPLPTTVPKGSLIASALPRIDYADAFSAPLPTGVTNAEQLLRACLGKPSRSGRALFAVRDAFAGAAGLKTAQSHETPPPPKTPEPRDRAAGPTTTEPPDRAARVDTNDPHDGAALPDDAAASAGAHDATRDARRSLPLPIGRVIAERSDEILWGLDDKHLDFRSSFIVRDNAGIVVTTVQFHNRLGRVYFAIIKPFHKLIIRRMLASAQRRSDGKSSRD